MLVKGATGVNRWLPFYLWSQTIIQIIIVIFVADDALVNRVTEIRVLFNLYYTCLICIIYIQIGLLYFV